MFRKKHVLEVGGYKQLLYAEDYYLWVRLLVEGYTILNMDEILVYVQAGKICMRDEAIQNIVKAWRNSITTCTVMVLLLSPDIWFKH